MDLSYGKEYEEFREEVRSFLASNWPVEGDLSKEEARSRFRERAVERGYLAR